MSADLFTADYHAAELADAIVSAGASVWLLTGGVGLSGDRPSKAAPDPKRLGLSAQTLAHLQLVRAEHGNIWLRDFGPIPVRVNDRLALLDLAYSDPGTPATDQVPERIATVAGLPVKTVEVALDGGDFLTDGFFCFTSRSDPSITEALRTSQLSRLGCAKPVLLKNVPHPHVDMWIKVLRPGQVVVNELDARSLKVAAELYGEVPEDLIQLRDKLNRQANELGKMVSVKRIPMPLPFRGTFRTYANALLVNKTAIIPRYRHFGWTRERYPDAVIIPAIEAEVAEIYRQAGFTPKFIDADALIYNGGAFRCVTAVIPNIHS